MKMYNEVKITTRLKEEFLITLYENEIVISDDQHVYRWNPLGSAWVIAVQHGGNFLHGTEYRRSPDADGAWECLAVSYGHVHTARLYHHENDIPDLELATALLNGGANIATGPLAGISRTDHWNPRVSNPIGGKNDQWITFAEHALVKATA